MRKKNYKGYKEFDDDVELYSKSKNEITSIQVLGKDSKRGGETDYSTNRPKTSKNDNQREERDSFDSSEDLEDSFLRHQKEDMEELLNMMHPLRKKTIQEIFPILTTFGRKS